MREQDTLFGLLDEPLPICGRHFRQWRRRQRIQRLLAPFGGSYTAMVATALFMATLAVILAVVQ